MRKEADDALVLEESDLCRIPARQRESNKGTYGPLLCIAGSEGMAGAAYLTALGAYRSGAGLVRILTPEVNRSVLQIQLPEAIVESYDLETEAVTAENPERQFLAQQQGSITVSEEEEPAGQAKNQRLPLPLVRLEELLASSKAVVIGPGLGQSEAAVALVKETLSRCEVPLVVDADALNLIARRPSLLSCRKSNWIFTPHPGEMSRLTEHEIPEILCESRAIAAAYRDHYGVTVCLKTSESIIAVAESQKIYRNESGTPALAKAGSGDVLSGIISGLLCLGMEPGAAAAYGAYLHGRAGQVAAGKFSLHGILARDIADAVPTVMRSAQTIELEDMGEE